MKAYVTQNALGHSGWRFSTIELTFSSFMSVRLSSLNSLLGKRNPFIPMIFISVTLENAELVDR